MQTDIAELLSKAENTDKNEIDEQKLPDEIAPRDAETIAMESTAHVKPPLYRKVVHR